MDRRVFRDPFYRRILVDRQTCGFKIYSPQVKADRPKQDSGAYSSERILVDRSQDLLRWTDNYWYMDLFYEKRIQADRLELVSGSILQKKLMGSNGDRDLFCLPRITYR